MSIKKAFSSSLKSLCSQIVESSDEEFLLRSLRKLYKLFEQGQVIYAVLIRECIPDKIAELLKHTVNQDLIKESLLILNNIIARCDSRQCREVVELGIVSQLVGLVNSTVPAIQEQAVWILDNIAVDSEQRNPLIDVGALLAILEVLKGKVTREVEVIASKALHTFTIGGQLRHPQHAAEITGILDAAEKLLSRSHKGKDIAFNVACALANMTEDEEGQQDTIAEVFTRPAIVRRLVQLVAAESTQSTAIAALTHLASAPEEQLDELVSHDLLPVVAPLLRDRNQKTVASVCRLLSHICAGRSTVIQAVIDEGAFPVVIDLAAKARSLPTRVYASYCVLHAMHGADLRQTRYLVDSGIIPVVCGLLYDGDKQQRALAVEAMRSLQAVLSAFNFASDFEYCSALVGKHGGWDNVAALRENRHSELREAATVLDEETLRQSYHARLTGASTAAAMTDTHEMTAASPSISTESSNTVEAKTVDNSEHSTTSVSETTAMVAETAKQRGGGSDGASASALSVTSTTTAEGRAPKRLKVAPCAVQFQL